MEVMKKDMISRFQGKFKSIFACVIEDSTNEATQNSFEVMSPRFLMHCKGDEDKARKMWKDMLSWRQHNEIDTLLERSVPHFAAMKRHCPSAFHGRTREGKLVFYERVGAYQIGSMKKDKLGPKHVTSFTAFIQEYIFTHLITNDEERYMSVLDVRGISWGVVSGDSINAMKATSETIQNNFPERVSNLMIINAPEWFTGAWKFVEKILAANIERVTIHSEEETLAALQEYLEDENIPACYGGQCQHLLGAHPFERALWEAARAGPPTVFEGAAPTPGGAGGAVATASPAPSGLGALGGGAPAAASPRGQGHDRRLGGGGGSSGGALPPLLLRARSRSASGGGGGSAPLSPVGLEEEDPAAAGDGAAAAAAAAAAGLSWGGLVDALTDPDDPRLRPAPVSWGGLVDVFDRPARR